MGLQLSTLRCSTWVSSCTNSKSLARQADIDWNKQTPTLFPHIVGDKDKKFYDIDLDITTLSITTFSIMTHSITTLSNTILWYRDNLQGGWKVTALRFMGTKPLTFLSNLNCHCDYANPDSSGLSVTKLWEILPAVKFMTDA